MRRTEPGGASDRMRRQVERDTGPEIALRRELHRRGRRFRIHRRPIADVRRTADIVFPGARVAVFVDGCFWHGCPDHGTWPKRNASFWSDKIETNRARDADTDARLIAERWVVVRVWEHEDVVDAADKIEALLESPTTV